MAFYNTEFQAEFGKSSTRAVVIGTGFGGLAAAIRLRAKGYQVTMVEGTDQPGGRASVFKRDGFTFDAGPTVITAPYLLQELFTLLGEDWQEFFSLVPIDPFYRIVFHDGSHFDYVGEEDRILENIRSLSPQDVDGYRKLAEHSRRIFDVGYTKLADKPFEKWTDMLKVAPDMIRLQNYQSVYGLVSRYIKDERLRQAFSFEPLLVGGNPFTTTSIYLLIHWLERKWGVWFVKGGTTALVQSMVRLLKKHHVDIQLSSPVHKIRVEKGKVQGVEIEDGRFIPADLVVSNADPMRVYGQMIDTQWLKKHSPRRLARKKASMSLFVAYFGAKKTYPDLAHHTILLGPRYKGLLKDIFSKRVLADDFSLYLHAPTRTDASLAPEGHECFYVLSPVPNNLSGINWQEEGERYCEKIFNWLDKNHLPGLKANLISTSFVSPDYFERNLRSHQGSGFGLEPNFRQSAYFRFHNRSEDVEGLYFVGASTHPGAGVPGVLNSARLLDRLIPQVQDLGRSTFRGAADAVQEMGGPKRGDELAAP